MPDLNSAREGKDGKDEGLDHRQGLSYYQQAMTIEPVGHDPREGCEYERRYLAGESYDTQKERRIRHAIDEPAHSDRLHPCADKGYALAHEK